MKKYLYCPECETYPRDVVYFLGLKKEYRMWTGELYSVTGTDEDPGYFSCGECGHRLEDRRKKNHG